MQYNSGDILVFNTTINELDIDGVYQVNIPFDYAEEDRRFREKNAWSTYLFILYLRDLGKIYKLDNVTLLSSRYEDLGGEMFDQYQI